MYFRIKQVGGAGCTTCACADISCMCSPHVCVRAIRTVGALATVAPLASLDNPQNLAVTSNLGKPSNCRDPSRRAPYKQSHPPKPSTPRIAGKHPVREQNHAGPATPEQITSVRHLLSA